MSIQKNIPRATIAYIDGANLHKSITALGWKMNYRFFLRWMTQKYNISTAYIFIGFIASNTDLYTRLQGYGYQLIFKETTFDGAGNVKGNCDADLVLKVAQDFYEGRLEAAVLVTSDGDYSSLAAFLKKSGRLRTILSPSNNCSFLLRKLNVPIAYLDQFREKLSSKG